MILDIKLSTAPPLIAGTGKIQGVIIAILFIHTPIIA
jgi:hypothetical protein